MSCRIRDCALIAILAWLVSFTVAGAAELTKSEARLELAAQRQMTTFIMFYRQNDAATTAMHRTIASSVEQLGERATWLNVNINDPAEAALVQRFDATRSPMPTVVGLAPNGAVTGVYPGSVQPQQIERSILSPQYAAMVKALQDKKVAVLCLAPAGARQTPQGVREFLATPAFKGQIELISASAADPAEASLFQRMKVQPNLTSPVVILFAPPGVHLGSYDASVSGAVLATKVHQSGSCNCEKCQHGH